ncbi:helix-turn-helix transcriptional regulator [Pseudocitrobacter cyperus]|uniref:LuxR family transcriptional regulator n=1 Tax=Pseudocitrobacter cyperus TaxID=3112843 RepID=A0ABV0HPL0_9ENTR
MMKNKILISHDRYLYHALEEFVPELQYLNINGSNPVNIDALWQGDSCFLLVDNRVPFYFIEKFRALLIDKKIKVDVTVLEMKGAIYFRKGYEHYKKIDMRGGVSACRDVITASLCGDDFSEMKNFSWQKRFIRGVDLELMRLTQDGVSIAFIAEQFRMSVKRVYFHRERFYRDLGFDSYNQACIFVIHNGLLN